MDLTLIRAPTRIRAAVQEANHLTSPMISEAAKAAAEAPLTSIELAGTGPKASGISGFRLTAISLSGMIPRESIHLELPRRIYADQYSIPCRRAGL